MNSIIFYLFKSKITAVFNSHSDISQNNRSFRALKMFDNLKFQKMNHF
jgi:hypothetical protein